MIKGGIMRRWLPFFGMFLVAGGLVAGVPNRIIYQGRLFKSGVGVNGDKTIRLTLVKSDGKTVVDTKSFGVTLPATGEFTIVWDLDKEIDWRGDQPELKVEVDTDELTPRQQFSANPYAFVAKRVEVGAVDSLSIADGAVTSEKISSEGIDPEKINLASGKTLSDWVLPNGQITANAIQGDLKTTANHANKHQIGGEDELQLDPSQVAGVVVTRSSYTQVMQATTNSVPVLAVKGLPGSSSKVLQIYDSGTVGDTSSVPQEQAHFDKDGNFVSNRNVSTSGAFAGASAYLSGSLVTNIATVNSSLGVGTVSPKVPLHVSSGEVGGGVNGYTRMLVESTDHTVVTIKSPNNKVGQIAFSDSDSPTSGGITYNHEDDSLSVRVNELESLKISGNGNVGVGNSSPSEKLHVSGPSNVFTRVEGNGVSGMRLVNKMATGTEATIYAGDNGVGGKNSLVIGDATAQPKVVVKTDTGRLGIGTTAPSATLDVNGDANIAGTIRGASFGFGGMYATSDVGSGNAYNNPLTGGKSCPSGFTAYPVIRVRTAEPEAGAILYMCIK